jgi:hypothetical protein
MVAAVIAHANGRTFENRSLQGRFLVARTVLGGNKGMFEKVASWIGASCLVWLHLAAVSLLVATPAHAQIPAPPSGAGINPVQMSPLRARQWTIYDDGHFVEAENAVLRLKFAYNAQAYQGWFMGTGTGGGGRDGGIVELYYKPTSRTRNLIFRNGTWGSGYDNMDLFEAESQGGTQANFDAPDYESGRHAVMNSHTITESAGRLIATFDFQFAAWHIVRTYTVYPWGDITVHSTLTVTQTSNWNYLGHRFSFGVSPYSFSNGSTTYNWGGLYRNEGDTYHAWTDGAPGGVISENFYEYARTISPSTNENSAAYYFGRTDQYSGFLIEDGNGDDPDILVFPAARTIYASPFQQIPRRLSTAGGIGAYTETALFNPGWAPNSEGVAQMTYFYMTTPSGQYGVQTTWPTSLGTWDETFHVLLRPRVTRADYLSLWKQRVRDLATEQPTPVSGGTMRFDPADNLYHFVADGSGSAVQFQWTRTAGAASRVDYRTTFVVDGFEPKYVQLSGAASPAVDAYYDPATRQTLLVLSGEQDSTPQTLTIVVGK